MADDNPSAIVVAPHPGSRHDIRDLFELAEDSKSQLERYMTDGEVFIALFGEPVVGHIQLITSDDGQSVEIKNMAVRPQQQGRGIGRALVVAGLDRARHLGCTWGWVATATADVGNLRFYQRLGFRMVCVERDAFGSGTGYPEPVVIDGIELRDRVWLDIRL
ncbi:MAG: GNAT family N-acetyltransferase [Acidimicrobiales bacterium]